MIIERRSLFGEKAECTVVCIEWEQDGRLCLVMECDVGSDSDRVWLADRTDLRVILLSAKPVRRVLPRLYGAYQSVGPWRQATSDLFSEYGVGKVNVLNTLWMSLTLLILWLFSYYDVPETLHAVWKIARVYVLL